MGDYPTKAHTGAIHQHVRPYYLQMPNSPRTLLRADKPSSRRGCVELLGSPYYKGVPLPRIPSIHKLGTKSRIAQRTEHATVGQRGTYSHAGQSTTKPRRQYSKPGGIAQHASTIRIPRNRAVIDAARHINGIHIQTENHPAITGSRQAVIYFIINYLRSELARDKQILLVSITPTICVSRVRSTASLKFT